MRLNSVLALGLVARSIEASHILRFSCSQLVTERLDPLVNPGVNPGVNPSAHMHQIVGGVSSSHRTRPEHIIMKESRILSFPTDEESHSCWDGVNVDSVDHKSHVAYPTGASCPSTHPVEVPQIFIETIWDIGVFDQSLWPEHGNQPFVLSQGDPTGFGHHADYVFGWKGDSLQKAMDARCDVYDASPDPLVFPASGCPQLKTQDVAVANKCGQKQIAVEDLDVRLPSLPGGMPVTWN